MKFGNGSGSFSTSGNLIVNLDSEANILEIHSTLNVKNLVLYKGTLKLFGNVSVSEDAVLLGNKYEDGDETWSFKYNKPRKSVYRYKGLNTDSLDVMPDGSPLPSVQNFDGRMIAADKVILNVGKNFYANGTSMSGISGEWYLDIDMSSDATVCFAEAYLCDISNSVVR